MGHSMFSIIPLEYALKYPEHASHAISTGGVPSFSEKSTKTSNEFWETDASEERKEILKRNREELTEEVMSKLSPSEAFIRQYIADTPLRFYDPEYDMSDLWEGIEINMDFVNHYWELIYGFDNTDKYHLIKAPVLIITGRYDYGCPYFLYDEVKDIIPNYSFMLFENAGHNPMFEIREEFNKKLIEWIKSTKGVGNTSTLSDKDLSAIRKLHNDFEQALLDANWVEIIPAFYEETAVQLEKRQPPVRGKSAIIARLENWRGLVFKERKYTIEKIDGRGGLAYVWGLITQSVEFKGIPSEGGAKMLRIFKKQPYGSWLISVEIWCYNDY